MEDQVISEIVEALLREIQRRVSESEKASDPIVRLPPTTTETLLQEIKLELVDLRREVNFLRRESPHYPGEDSLIRCIS